MARIRMLSPFVVWFILISPCLGGVQLSLETRNPQKFPEANEQAIISKIPVSLQVLGIRSTNNSKPSHPLESDLGKGNEQQESTRDGKRSKLIHTSENGVKVVLLIPGANSERQTAADVNSPVIISHVDPRLRHGSSSVSHRARVTTHAHTHSDHLKYHATHVDLPGEHGNNFSFPVVHRERDNSHRHDHSDHSAASAYQETHVDLPGEHDNLSPHPVVHRVSDSSHAHTAQQGRHRAHIDLPGEHGNETPYPVIHRHSNIMPHGVRSQGTIPEITVPARTVHAHSRQGGLLPTSARRGARPPTDVTGIPPYEPSESNNLPQYAAFQGAVGSLSIQPQRHVFQVPTSVEGGVPLTRQFIQAAPPSATYIGPGLNSWVPGGFIDSGLRLGLMSSPYVPLPPFGPLAHLPPFLRERIRFRRLRRRMRRRFRRLRMMRELGLLGPYEPFAGPLLFAPLR